MVADYILLSGELLQLQCFKVYELKVIKRSPPPPWSTCANHGYPVQEFHLREKGRVINKENESELLFVFPSQILSRHPSLPCQVHLCDHGLSSL